MGDALRISSFRLACCDVAATAGFYERAFGFTRASVAEHGGDLALADGTIEFRRAARRSTPSASNETTFQHLAMVVSDMAAALARLEDTQGWTPISRAGPERLPQASGGVTAFKFRDPEGHPLEFLAFPPDRTPDIWRHNPRAGQAVLGVDHSAITVADVERSIDYYAGFGFIERSRQVNRGVEQARMDNAEGAIVDVVTLIPHVGSLHLELLHYRAPATRVAAAGDDETSATEILLTGDTAQTIGPVDPDGHRLKHVLR